MEQFTSEWQAWHDRRLAALATPFGFLSITGLHWLQQGSNTWEGAPGHFDLDGDTISFRIGAGRTAGPTRSTLEAEAAQERVGASAAGSSMATVLGTATDGSPWIRLARDASLPWLVADHTAYEAINRDGWIGIRVRDSKSALLANFVDIPTFPLQRTAVVPGVFAPFPEPRIRRIDTAMPGLSMDAQTVGTVTFELGGSIHTLTASGSAETGLIVDFHDETNRDSTPAWRSLCVGIPNGEGAVTLDFNRAVIYPFAFMPWATCPAPVEENVLSVAVRAGEQSPTRTLSEEGLNHPVSIITMSGGFPLPEALDWLEKSGTELFRHRAGHGSTLPGPTSASAFIVFGMEDREGHSDQESIEVVREFADDALAVGTPVIGIGTSGARVVFDAARHLAATTVAATAPDDYADADHPLFSTPMPVVVSADVANDRVWRGCVTMSPDSAVGFVDVEGLAAEIGDTSEARRHVWTALIDRFSTLVVKNDRVS